MRRRRAGFSLVELMVVIAIITVLLAIALPSVQQMRQSARNTECKSKLRQLVIGLQNHQSQFGYLPRDGTKGWGYATFLLPQIEQANLFQQINPGTNSFAVNDPVQAKATNTVVDVYICPSFLKDPNLASGFGRLNYLGNSQLINQKRMQFADVLDGESKTIAFGETTSDYSWAQPATATGSSPPSSGSTFASQHGNGANFAICDGSIRWINSSIDSKIFAALFTIAAGDLVGDF